MRENTTLKQMETDIHIVFSYYIPTKKEFNICIKNIKKKIIKERNKIISNLH